MKLPLPWSQRRVRHSLSLHVIKTGLWTSMREMCAYKWEGCPSGSNQRCLFGEHHLLRTRPQRDETQSRCLLFGNTSTVSSYTPEWIPLTTWLIPHIAAELCFNSKFIQNQTKTWAGLPLFQSLVIVSKLSGFSIKIRQKKNNVLCHEITFI